MKKVASTKALSEVHVIVFFSIILGSSAPNGALQSNMIGDNSKGKWMVKNHKGFNFVVEHIARSLVKEIQDMNDNVMYLTKKRSSIKNIPTFGYREILFQDFEELDYYFRELIGADWRSQEWAKYWMKSHNADQTREYDRNIKDKDGRIIKGGMQEGSTRYEERKEGPKQILRRVPKPILLAIIDYYKGQGYTSYRQLEAVLFEKENIKISDTHIERLMKGRKDQNAAGD